MDEPMDPTSNEVGLNLDWNQPAETGVSLAREIIDRRMADDAQRDQTLAAEERTLGDQWGNIASQTLIGEGYEYLFLRPQMAADPHFKSDRFEHLYAEAAKTTGVPTEFLSDLYKSQSEEEFKWRLGQAQRQFKATNELMMAGWGTWSAALAVQMADGIVVGGGLAGLAYRIGKASQVYEKGRLAQRAYNAVGLGLVPGLLHEGAKDALGVYTPTENYLMAAGLGLLLSGLAGPLSKDADLAATLFKNGEELLRLPPPLKQLPAPPKQELTTFRAVKDASEQARLAADDTLAATDVPQLRKPEEAVDLTQDPKTGEWGIFDDIEGPDPKAIEAAYDDLAEALGLPPRLSGPQAVVDDVADAVAADNPSVAAAIDELVNPAPAAAAADEVVPPVAPVAPEVPVKVAPADVAKAINAATDLETLTNAIESAKLTAKEWKDLAFEATGKKAKTMKEAKERLHEQRSQDLLLEERLSNVRRGLDEAAPPAAPEAASEPPAVSPRGDIFDNPKVADEAMEQAGKNDGLDLLNPAQRQSIRETAERAAAFMKRRRELHEEKKLKDALAGKKKPAKAMKALPEGENRPGELEDNGDGTVNFKGTTYRRTHKDGDYEQWEAYRDGIDDPIGWLELNKQEGDDRLYIPWIEVARQYQGTPVAHGLSLIAQRAGVTNIPDGTLSMARFNQYAKRLAWVRDAYVVNPFNDAGGTVWYVSAKRVLQNIEDTRLILTRKLSPDMRAKRERELVYWEKSWAEFPAYIKEPENLKSMFKSLADPMAGRVAKPGAWKIVNDIWDRILPDNVGRQITDELDPRGNLDGMYKERVVYAALNADNPAKIAYHEATHALKALGLIVREDWDKLVAKARKVGADKRYRISERYKDEKLAPEQFDEEAVAHMMAGRMTGESFGLVDTILDKTINVLRKLRDVLGIQGFRTVNDVFDDFKSGKLAKGEQHPIDEEVEAMYAKANWMDPGTWASMTPGSAMRGALGRFRIDRAAGSTARSKNDYERLAGMHLMNESVGRADHGVTPQSADQAMMRIQLTYQGEYYKTYDPAFAEWAKSLNLSMKDKLLRQHEFDEGVTMYLRQKHANIPTPNVHAAMKRVGDKYDKLMDRALKDLKDPMAGMGRPGQGRAVNGSEWLNENKPYLSRFFDARKVLTAVETHGYPAVLAMVRGAIGAANQGIDPGVLDKLSRGYLKNIQGRAAGLGDEWSMAWARSDQDRLRAIMMDEAGARLTQGEADDILRRVFGKLPEGDMANLKRRTFLDENYSSNGLAFHDLLESNITNIFEKYTRRMAGRVALARVQMVGANGRLLVNGFTSNFEIDDYINKMAEWGVVRNGQTPDEVRLSQDRIRFAFNHILGTPQPNELGSFAAWLKIGRNYMTTRLLGQVGFAQLGDTGNSVGFLGYKSLIKHIPAYGTMIDQLGSLRAKNPLHEELEASMLGLMRNQIRYRNEDEMMGNLPFTIPGKPTLEKWLNYSEMGANATYQASGMTLITKLQELQFAGNMIDKIATMGTKLQSGRGLGRGDVRRLAQLGLDPAMIRRITSEMRTNADFEESVYFGWNTSKLNLDKWQDQEARAMLEGAVFRATKKVIQSGDLGSAAMWMHYELAKSIFQFRGYGFTAWGNNFLYNVHMGDPRTLIIFANSVMFASAIRAAQVGLVSAARSDGDEYRKKYLSPWELGKSGFQRSAWGSLWPTGIDTALYLAGQDPQFTSRTSGQASNLLLGNPMSSFPDAINQGVGGAINSISGGRAMAQTEVRSLVSMLPFSNLLPVAMGVSALSQPLNQYAPRERGKQ